MSNEEKVNTATDDWSNWGNDFSVCSDDVISSSQPQTSEQNSTISEGHVFKDVKLSQYADPSLHTTAEKETPVTEPKDQVAVKLPKYDLMPIRQYNKQSSVATSIRGGKLKGSGLDTIVFEFCPKHNGTQQCWIDNKIEICLKLDELIMLNIGLSNSNPQNLEFLYHDGNHLSIVINKNSYTLSLHGRHQASITGNASFMVLLKCMVQEVTNRSLQSIYPSLDVDAVKQLVKSVL